MEIGPLASKLISQEILDRTGTLILGNCGLTEIPSTVFSMHWLKVLVLSNFYIANDNKRIKANENNNAPNKISHIDVKIRDLISLEELDISGELAHKFNISDVTPLGTLKKLTTLRLSHNEIKDIAPLANLKNLKKLRLNKNKISNISSLSNMKELLEVGLNDNKVYDINPLQLLEKITILQLRHNEIIELDAISNLSNLTELDLRNNKVVRLPLFSQLKFLKTLDLSNNKIIDISPISSLSNLVNLSLQHNNIMDIEKISKLKNIKYLNLGSNMISNITPLKLFTEIERVDLSFNSISDISPLEMLIPTVDLQWTGFGRKTGRWIRLWGNPLESSITDILTQEPSLSKNQKLIDYFSAGAKLIQRIKLILIGNTKTGKTLLHDIVTEGNLSGPITHGLKIFHHPLKHLNEEITIEGYDFGGQDYYHNTHFSFFDSQSLYVLLWGNGQKDEFGTLNFTNSEGLNIEENIFPLNYWLSAVKYYTQHQEGEIHYDITYASENTNTLSLSSADLKEWEKKIHLLLLQNPKKGSVQEDLNEKELKEKYKSIKDISTFCLLTNSTEAKKWITTAIYNFSQKVKKVSVAKLDFELWQYMKKNNSNVVIGINEFKSLSEETKTYTTEKFINLLRRMHSNLYCYYIPEETINKKSPKVLLTENQKKILSSNVITNLEIFTKWMYDILDIEIKDDGYFTKEEAKKRLQKGQAQNSIEFILAFMLYNKIIFPVNGYENKYVAPQYLPNKQNIVENILLDAFDDPIVKYYLTGFYHAGLITEILLGFYDQLVQENDGWKYVLWKDKVLLYENKEDRKRILLIEQKIDKTNESHLVPTIHIRRFSKEVISDQFIQKVIFFIDQVLLFQEHEKWIVTPYGNYIPFNCLRQNNKINQTKESGLVHFENKIYRKGDFRFFLNEDERRNFAMKKIFISYSKQDLAYVNTFLDHLSVLKLDNKIATWFCAEIEAGVDWDYSIKSAFAEANIVCFMISPNFMRTDYIQKIEIKEAFERFKRKEEDFKIIPIILDFCNWKTANNDLSIFNALPFTAKPVADFENENMAWYIIEFALRNIIDKNISSSASDFESEIYTSEATPIDILKIYERIIKGKTDRTS